MPRRQRSLQTLSLYQNPSLGWVARSMAILSVLMIKRPRTGITLTARFLVVLLLMLFNGKVYSAEVPIYRWTGYMGHGGEHPTPELACKSAISLTRYRTAFDHAEIWHNYAYDGNAATCFWKWKGGPGTVSFYSVYRVGEGCPPGTTLSSTGECELDKNAGPENCPVLVGNPINVLTGSKYQQEQDYVDAGIGKLSFSRFYNSTDNDARWSHTFGQHLGIHAYTNTTVVYAYQANGAIYRFIGNLSEGWTGDSDKPQHHLEAIKDSHGAIVGWRLLRNNHTRIDTYDSEGRLLSIAVAGVPGTSYTLSYHTIESDPPGDETTQITVTDRINRSITLTQNQEGQLTSLQTPDGLLTYRYHANGFIDQVRYPDGHTKHYHYENTDLPHALTGISDEKNIRFATWTYDSEGRATSSEHAGGAETTTLDYSHIDDSEAPRVTVTNALGKETTYHYRDIQGARKVTQIEGHPSQNCAAANRAYTYYDTFDGNGLVASKTDWQGNMTTYLYNDRGQETSRTEASGTPQARTITTEWHPDLNRATAIHEPLRDIIMTYDSQGRLQSRTVKEKSEAPQ